MRKIPLPIEQLNLAPREAKIAQRLIATAGPLKGHLRASKPPVDKSDPDTGIAAYVWRQVVFAVSDERQHQCMPVMDFCDLPGAYRSPEYQAAETLAKELEDKIVSAIPKQEWHGVKRWGKALGRIA